MEGTEFNHDSLLISLNSRNRVRGTTTDFICHLGPEVRNYNFKRLVVKSVNFPNLQYNINSNNNVLRIVTDVDGVLTYNIPVGQYNITQLNNNLNSGLSALATNTITVSLGTTSNLLSVAIDVGTVQVLSDAVSTAAATLGFTQNSAVAASVTADRIIRLNGLTQVYIRSNALSVDNLHSSDGQAKSYLTSIQIREAFGSYVYYEPQFSEMASVNFKNRIKLDSDIDIQLLDQDENVLDIGTHDVDIELVGYYLH